MDINTTVPKFKELWRETEIFETVRKGAGDINVQEIQVEK